VLAQAGSAFHASPAAIEALSEFGGLRVDVHGAGMTMARQSFVLDPTLAIGEDDRFGRYGSVVGTELFPLGEGGGGHYFLAIAPDGFVYGIGDFIFEVGCDIRDALQNLVRGVRFTRPPR
jgi:SUKH-3 immunity protein